VISTTVVVVRERSASSPCSQKNGGLDHALVPGDLLLGDPVQVGDCLDLLANRRHRGRHRRRTGRNSGRTTMTARMTVDMGKGRFLEPAERPRRSNLLVSRDRPG